MLAKLERQRQQAKGNSEAHGSKASPSPSDRSKSMTPEEGEPNDEGGQNASDRQYSEFASVPALSPPTPNQQVLPVPPHSAGSMARSVSHNTTLVTPDENSVHTRTGGQSSSAPFVPVHSQSTYSYSATEKTSYLKAQHGSYESRPPYGQGSSSTSVIGSMLNNPDGNGDFQFQQAVTYNTMPTDPSDNLQPQSAGTTAGSRAMKTQNIAYANVPVHSLVNDNTSQQNRRPKDYFDGVVVFNQSTPPGFAAEPPSNEIYTDPHTQSQPQPAQRPVFTMPFGNSDAAREAPENPSIDLSHVKGPWQRWYVCPF